MNKLKYHFDNLVSKGTGPLMTILTVSTLIFVFITGSIAFYVRGDSVPYLQTLWYTFNHVVDPGYLFGEGGESVFFLALMTLSTFWGVLVYSLVISFVATALGQKIERLQSGRSEVFAKNHIVILDYNDTVPIMVQELNEAYGDSERNVVVILSDQDALSIHQHIRSIVPKKKQLKLLVRKGNIHLKSDLEKMHVDDAKAVIIASISDVSTIKTLLALKQTQIFSAHTPGHVVCVIKDHKNVATAKDLGQKNIEVVYVAELKSRVLARSSLHPGLSSIYKNIFSFVGEEILFLDDERFIGQTMKDLVLTLNHTSAIGMVKQGTAQINLPSDTRFEKGDQLISIAENAQSYQFIKEPFKSYAPTFKNAPYVHTGRKILTIGFNKSTPYVIKDMEKNVGEDSSLVMLVPTESAKDKLLSKHPESMFEDFKVQVGNTFSRQVLEELNLTDFDTIAIFANQDLTEEDADAESLMTLLHIHNLLEGKKKKPSVVIEIEEAQNTEALAYVNVDDFLVSHILISKIMTQIAENRVAHQVIEELVSDSGPEFYLRRANTYIKDSESLPLRAYKEAALAKNQIMVGYKLDQHPVILNPDFTETIPFGPKDRIVIVS